MDESYLVIMGKRLAVVGLGDHLGAAGAHA